MATIDEQVRRGDLLSPADLLTREAQNRESDDRSKKYAELEKQVNAAAFATGKEQPVKIRMHHGSVVSIGRQNALIAIKRGDAELVSE